VSEGLRLYKNSERGGTWWGRRWIESVARFCGSKQLERGLRYAKSGQVLSIQVDQGFAAADVQGTRARPYKVEIGLPMFTAKQWLRVTNALLKKAFYTAKLLAGEMPSDIEPIFQSAGAPLLPTSETDISSDCSCFDLEDPCKHVAAVYYILGQEIDRDPFLLMEMRGLTRAKLLAEIQARRGAGGKSRGKKPAVAPSFEKPAPTLLSHRLNDFYQAPKDRPLTWSGEPDYLDHLLKPGVRIHEMGSPPFWQSDNNFEDVLTRIYQAVRKRVLSGLE
jgi:uncharacterized Zn finger protein